MAGLRSAPPPNQRFVVARKRVFIWTAGTCGLAMWATRLMPVAKKLGSCSAPWMVAANSGLKRPPTVETLTPTFSNTLPFISPRTPPPPSDPFGSSRSQAVDEAGLAAGLRLDLLEFG